MYLYIVFSAGAVCRHRLINEISTPKESREQPLVYVCQLFSVVSVLCRLALLGFFLCRPSNVSAPKAALRLSCCPQSGFMAKQE
jgi:hypothetical protein